MDLMGPKQASNKNPFTPKMAMCLVLPYTTDSSQMDKAIGNGALLAENIRYYTNLGFQVYVYDRDGMNRKHIQNRYV